ncbi:hypothetical protein N665_0549s0018 [Sinapis alba]|nr:hypothetical protein N665_0549s0018 [Sinapis alba]
MADPNGPFIAHVKRNGSVVNVHKGPNGNFLMTNEWQVLRKAQWPEMYQSIKGDLEERKYTGELNVIALFTKTTDHVPLDMVLKLSENGIRCVDLRKYDADPKDLEDAADHGIIAEIVRFTNLDENQPPRNIMVMSGDTIFHAFHKELKDDQGYRTLDAFRPNTCDEAMLNEEVENSWAWRQLLCLPWKVGNKPNVEQRRGRKRKSGSEVEKCYYEVSIMYKLTILVFLLKNHPSEKIITFFPYCNSVMYHAAMLRKLGVRC